MKLKQIGLIVYFLLVVSHSASGQSMSVVEDSVVIRDNRLQLPMLLQNRNITVLTKAQIRQLPVKSVNELLAYVAGVDIRQRGPWGVQSDISIDGSTFDQVLVLINGVKISDPQTGHNMMNLSLPITAIDHIEVLRGPSARVYGVNALAGAVNIVTKKAKENAAVAQVYAGSSFQSDTATGKNYYGAGAQASASLAGKHHAHNLSLSADEGNGYRHNTAFQSRKVFYHGTVATGKRGNFEALGAFTKNKFGANGFYSTPGDKESEEAVETILGSIGYRFQPNEKVSITPRVSYRHNTDDYIYIRQKPEAYHNIHKTRTLTAEVQSSIRTRNGMLGAGIEWREEGINSSNLGERQRENTGVFLEYRHSWRNRIHASAGLFANFNTDYGWQYFPGIDLGYQVSNAFKLFAAYTSGQRLPTYTDLYYSGPLNIGNAELMPEYANYLEGGFQFSQRLVGVKASYFYRHVTDLIDWVRANDSLPWQPENVHILNTSGLTMQVNYVLSEHLKLPDDYTIGLNLSYTYLDQEIRAAGEGLSKYAVEGLRHQLIARVNSRLFNKLEVNMTGRYQQRINGNDYTVLDIRLGYKAGPVLIYSDLNNLLDTQYKEIGTIQMPGRWVTLGFRAEF